MGFWRNVAKSFRRATSQLTRRQRRKQEPPPPERVIRPTPRPRKREEPPIPPSEIPTPFPDINPRDVVPVRWYEREKDMYIDAFQAVGVYDDWVAQTMFNEAYFNFDAPRDQIRRTQHEFEAYMRRTYGVEFGDIFDFEAYREAYGDLR